MFQAHSKGGNKASQNLSLFHRHTGPCLIPQLVQKIHLRALSCIWIRSHHGGWWHWAPRQSPVLAFRACSQVGGTLFQILLPKVGDGVVKPSTTWTKEIPVAQSLSVRTVVEVMWLCPELVGRCTLVYLVLGLRSKSWT